jgi:zinc protease
MINRIGLLILCAGLFMSASAERYAIVVSDTTNSMIGWSDVVDSLVIRHSGQVFVWQDSLQEVKSALADYRPDYIAFVGRSWYEIQTSFVEDIWVMTRELDADPYGDALWGLVTGRDYPDAMRIVQNQTLQLRTVLGGTNCTWDGWFYQGISTFEAQYNRIRFKIPDTSLIIDTICPPRCPDDRCTLLVNYINDGINDTILGYSLQGPVDYFITSGHGNVDVWQLHYPTPDLEGYFRSEAGQVYGDPRIGVNRYINSTNPKVYNAMGNCLVGNPSNPNYMPYGWLGSGGAIAMTGYMPTTVYGYMLWGLGSLLQMAQDRYTYAEAFYINNQELLFDEINNTPGTDPTGLDYDRDACCYYGDPAADIRMFAWRDPWWDQGLDVASGSGIDTITFWVEANYDSVDPGFSGTSGRRHPFAFLPGRYDSAVVIDSNCYATVITDNFVLMYCWKQGDPRLAAGETRYVKFIGYPYTGVEDFSRTSFEYALDVRVSPSVSSRSISVEFELARPDFVEVALFDALGRRVQELASEHFGTGPHEIIWNPRSGGFAAGVYFVRFRVGRSERTLKAVLTK